MWTRRGSKRSTRLAALTGLIGVLGLTSPAQALPVQYRATSVELDFADMDPGLVLFTDLGVLDTAHFELDDGDLKRIPVFIVGTLESFINLDDFLLERPISASLSFAMPSVPGSPVQGTSRGRWRFFADGLGRIRWDEAVLMTSGALTFEVSLSDISFGTPGSATVFADIRQISSVPEPPSVALLGLGVAGLLQWGWTSRRG